jgi:hypothetical protein
MKKTKKLMLSLPFVSLSTLALPLDPNIKSIAHLFSQEVQNNFHVFADTRSEHLMWYIPKHSSIANDKTQFQTPEIDIGNMTISSDDMLNGQSAVWVQGAFSLVGEPAALQILNNEATTLGYRLELAPLHVSDAKILTQGISATSINYSCDDVVIHQGKEYPICMTLDQDSNQSDFQEVIKLQTRRTHKKYFGFHFLALEFYPEEYKNIMGYYDQNTDEHIGMNWSDRFLGSAEVEVTTYKSSGTRPVPSHQMTYQIDLSIDCLQGGWDKPVQWVENAYCKKASDQTSETIQLNPTKSFYDQVKTFDALSKQEATQRVMWAEKCGDISSNDAFHMLNRPVYRGSNRHAYTPSRQPNYPFYTNAQQTSLWKAPTVTSEPCSHGPKNLYYPNVMTLSVGG